MRNLFEEIKNKLMEIAKDRNYFEPSGYYEIIMQNKDKFANILEDCARYDFHLSYRCDPDDYSYGYICINLCGMADHYYELEMSGEDRDWGYCQCGDEDDGYNHKHECCGENCDWYAPQIYITKHVYETNLTFQGLEKDLWKIQEKWEKENKEVKELVKQRQLQEIGRQIEDLQRQKQEIEAQ